MPQHSSLTPPSHLSLQTPLLISDSYKLALLSNIDNATIASTQAGPLAPVTFDAVYTAEDIGSYKPDLKNFYYLLEHVKSEFGVEKNEVLHTAQALRHGAFLQLRPLSLLSLPVKIAGDLSPWRS
jgi:hypothetical protein